MDMKIVLFFVVACLLISVNESTRRQRRQYYPQQYGAQQYGGQYGLYGPGGQGFVNNNYGNNRYPNQQGYGWNNNFNWNQGNRLPEWYYNSANTIQSSIFCFIPLVMYIFLV